MILSDEYVAKRLMRLIGLLILSDERATFRVVFELYTGCGYDYL